MERAELSTAPAHGGGSRVNAILTVALSYKGPREFCPMVLVGIVTLIQTPGTVRQVPEGRALGARTGQAAGRVCEARTAHKSPLPHR